MGLLLVRFQRWARTYDRLFEELDLPEEKLKDIDREQKEMYTSLFLILSDFRTKGIYFIISLNKRLQRQQQDF